MNSYNYEKLKELYESDNYTPDNSSINTSKQATTVDIFDEFSELNDFVNEPEPPRFRLEPEVLDITPKPDVSLFAPEDDMNKTRNIDLHELQTELSKPEIVDTIDKIYNGEPLNYEKPKRKIRLPWTVANDHHLENAFVNCAVLGFITAAIGSGMLIYIINHI